MDDFALMRVVHVLAVTLWIGGVGFVTLVVMPMLEAAEQGQARFASFERIEKRFAFQARIWVLLAGASGLWMIWRADLWGRFADPYIWWMHLMVAVWAVFALMLFVVEPLHRRRRLENSASPSPDFAHMLRLHRVLLVVSLAAIFGAVGGSHGLF